MGDYYEQARAIWSALDSMLEKDPEEYRKFVNEQLQDGQRMLSQKQKDASSKNVDQMNGLDQTFQTLSVNPATQISTTDKNRSRSSSSSSTKMKKPVHTKVSSSEPKFEKGHGDGEVSSDSTCSLLDSEVGGKQSIIAQIVKHEDLSTQDDHDHLELNMLEIDSRNRSNPYSKKKPMIEEL